MPRESMGRTGIRRVVLTPGSRSWLKRRVLLTCTITEQSRTSTMRRDVHVQQPGVPLRPWAGVRGSEPPDLPDAAAAAGGSGASWFSRASPRAQGGWGGWCLGRDRRAGGGGGLCAPTALLTGPDTIPTTTAPDTCRHPSEPASVRRVGLWRCPWPGPLSEARVRSHTRCLPHPLPPGTPHRAAVGGNRTVTGPICQVQHLGATKNLFSTL